MMGRVQLTEYHQSIKPEGGEWYWLEGSSVGLEGGGLKEGEGSGQFQESLIGPYDEFRFDSEGKEKFLEGSSQGDDLPGYCRFSFIRKIR